MLFYGLLFLVHIVIINIIRPSIHVRVRFNNIRENSGASLVERFLVKLVAIEREISNSRFLETEREREREREGGGKQAKIKDRMEFQVKRKNLRNYFSHYSKSISSSFSICGNDGLPFTISTTVLRPILMNSSVPGTRLPGTSCISTWQYLYIDFTADRG